MREQIERKKNLSSEKKKEQELKHCKGGGKLSVCLPLLLPQPPLPRLKRGLPLLSFSRERERESPLSSSPHSLRRGKTHSPGWLRSLLGGGGEKAGGGGVASGAERRGCFEVEKDETGRVRTLGTNGSGCQREGKAKRGFGSGRGRGKKGCCSDPSHGRTREVQGFC